MSPLNPSFATLFPPARHGKTNFHFIIFIFSYDSYQRDSYRVYEKEVMWLIWEGWLVWGYPINRYLKTWSSYSFTLHCICRDILQRCMCIWRSPCGAFTSANANEPRRARAFITRRGACLLNNKALQNYWKNWEILSVGRHILFFGIVIRVPPISPLTLYFHSPLRS